MELNVKKIELKLLLTDSQIAALLNLLLDGERKARQTSDDHYLKASFLEDFFEINDLNPQNENSYRFEIFEAEKFKYLSWDLDEIYENVCACLYDQDVCDHFGICE